MSPKTWVILTGGILGIVMMRLVIGQLLAIVERYPPLVDGAFVIIAWVGIKLVVEYLHGAGYIDFEIPKWLSLGLIVVIFAGRVLLRPMRRSAAAANRRVVRRGRPRAARGRRRHRTTSRLSFARALFLHGSAATCRRRPILRHETPGADARLRGVCRSGPRSIGADTIHARVWAPAAPAMSALSLDGRAVSTERAKPTATSRCKRRDGPATGIGFRVERVRAALSRSGLAVSARGSHTVRRRSSIRRRSRGPMAAWTGVSLAGQVLYELHPGTFTQPGTWTAAAAELAELARLGITVIELMPVAEFDGRFGWGYDGVDLFAPSHLYGTPDDLRAFVDRAHARRDRRHPRRGLQPPRPVGNYLREFSPAYFTDRYENEWGDAINFDGADAGPVREFFIANAGYWIDEFHLDGLRLDATQQIFDARRATSCAEIGDRRPRAARTAAVRSSSPRTSRRTPRLVRPATRGRLRPRRAVERRLPSQRDGGADRPRRGLLQRHARRAAGVHLGREVRLPVSGPVLQLAAASRAARRRSTSIRRRFVDLSAEPRSGRQLGARPARPPIGEPGDAGAR